MNDAPRKLNLDQWDARYEKLRRGGLRAGGVRVENAGEHGALRVADHAQVIAPEHTRSDDGDAAFVAHACT